MRSIKELFSLKDKVIIITGGAGLLGQTYTEAILLAEGHPVIADVRSENLKSLLDGFETDRTHDLLYCKTDITSERSVKNLIDQTIDKFGKIDGLINNAALTVSKGREEFKDYFSKFETYPLFLWDLALKINLTGMFLVTREVGKEMQKNPKGGSIVNISSTYGVVSPDHRIYQTIQNIDQEQSLNTPIGYAVCKSAVLNFTRYLASYWANFRIRVNTLTPGGVYENQDPQFVKNYCNRVPLGRMAQKSEYQGAIIFLLSDASSYMTGSNLVIDGGWTCW